MELAHGIEAKKSPDNIREQFHRRVHLSVAKALKTSYAHLFLQRVVYSIVRGWDYSISTIPVKYAIEGGVF